MPRASIYKLAQKGKMPGQKVCGDGGLRKKAIDRWLEGNADPAPDDRRG